MWCKMSDSGGEDVNEKLKIVLLGNCGVGKSSLALQLGQGIFREKYNPTLGVDFIMKRLTISEDINVVLQVWDLSGRVAGGNMLDKYLFGCQCIMLVYDVTNSGSFACLQGWLNVIVKSCEMAGALPKIMLLGNKIDLENTRAVRIEEHLAFANRNNMMHALVSAKAGDSVNRCFSGLVSTLLGMKVDVFVSGVEKELPLKIPSSKQSSLCILS